MNRKQKASAQDVFFFAKLKADVRPMRANACQFIVGDSTNIDVKLILDYAKRLD